VLLLRTGLSRATSGPGPQVRLYQARFGQDVPKRNAAFQDVAIATSSSRLEKSAELGALSAANLDLFDGPARPRRTDPERTADVTAVSQDVR
jgi:hypothetical protein